MHKVTSNQDKWMYESSGQEEFDRDLTFETEGGEVVVTASNSDKYLGLDVAIIYLSVFQAENLRDWLTHRIEGTKTTFGENVRKIRKERGLTQTEFGRLFGVSLSSVSNWENGRNGERGIC